MVLEMGSELNVLICWEKILSNLLLDKAFNSPFKEILQWSQNSLKHWAQ